MNALALCFVLFVGLSSALPLAPSATETPKETPKETKSKTEPGRFFVIQVNEQPRQQQQQREFPWPYPPVFEPYLPEEAKMKLTQLYEDPTLSAEERADKINAAFDSLPQQVIEQLPLPVEYERLPADVYKRILYIHIAPGFRWAERQQLIRMIIESLPEEQRQLMRTPRIGGPPPGFEYVLAPTVYKQLLFAHHNSSLTLEQKAALITQIMRQVPAEQINRLPLPSGMDRLPLELQQRLRSLVYDYSVPQAVRTQRVRQFVQQLPAEVRPPLRK
jgi:hypothetical protein